MEVGDHYTILLPVQRRWWQFWKPKEWAEEIPCVVTHAASSPGSIPSVWDASTRLRG